MKCSPRDPVVVLIHEMDTVEVNKTETLAKGKFQEGMVDGGMMDERRN